MTERIGEIIEADSFLFVAESFVLNRPPALGSLVKAQAAPDTWILGIVAFGETASVDPGRGAVRRSGPDAYDAAVYRRHPELEYLLRTRFTAIPVGSRAGGRVSQRIPSQPPPMHYSVYACGPDEVREFSERRLYLRTLATAPLPAPVEHVLAAHLAWAYEQRGRDEAWLEQAALEVAGLLQQDVERLLAVLYAVDPEA